MTIKKSAGHIFFGKTNTGDSMELLSRNGELRIATTFSPIDMKIGGNRNGRWFDVDTAANREKAKRAFKYAGLTSADTSGSTFNAVKSMVKPIPGTRKFSGKSFDLQRSSFSEVTIDAEIKRLRAVNEKRGSNNLIRKATYQRAGRTVYAIYIHR